MSKAALLAPLGLAILVGGCATMKSSSARHPGIVEPNPSAVTRTFPASATIVAQTMADVMSRESILDQISMVPDTSSKEFRNFSREDRQRLGISLLTPANDVNYDIKAKCKDGQPVAVAVRLKGDSDSEVSVLYGFGGESDLSKDLLDKLDAALANPGKAPAATSPSGNPPPQ